MSVETPLVDPPSVQLGLDPVEMREPLPVAQHRGPAGWGS